MVVGKVPRWLRALDVVLGLITIIMSGIVLFYPKFAISMLILILAIALLVIGVARLFTGIFARYLPDWSRAVNLGTGILMIVVAIVAMLYPQLATQMLIYLLSLAMLVHGTSRIVTGAFVKVFQRWLRVFLVVIGLLTIIMSIVVLVSPGLGFLTLVIMLSMTLLFNGVARVIYGLTGVR